ncbi:MAG: hypothetical protein Q9218_003201 [Villophora microphyllina]
MAKAVSCQWPVRSVFESLSLPRYICQNPYRSFSASCRRCKPGHGMRKGVQDAYAHNHARQRQAANKIRQTELKEQRRAALGDPIRGATTPFVESFDTGLPRPTMASIEQTSHTTTAQSPEQPPPSPANATEEAHLNYYLSKPELQDSLDYSRVLSEPLVPTDRERADPVKEAREAKDHEACHATAFEAVSRIVSLANATGRERTRANVQRIIDTFGRHNTDNYLKPKAPSLQSTYSTIADQTPMPRAGPDTGSSEVQIGILTAKIRVLADRYEGANRNDKAGKRDLRLLLHRRQKLLKYMQKKERGSQRWSNMIEKLGLTEATWKGQIAVE